MRAGAFFGQGRLAGPILNHAREGRVRSIARRQRGARGNAIGDGATAGERADLLAVTGEIEDSRRVDGNRTRGSEDVRGGARLQCPGRNHPRRRRAWRPCERPGTGTGLLESREVFILSSDLRRIKGAIGRTTEGERIGAVEDRDGVAGNRRAVLYFQAVDAARERDRIGAAAAGNRAAINDREPASDNAGPASTSGPGGAWRAVPAPAAPAAPPAPP